MTGTARVLDIRALRRAARAPVAIALVVVAAAVLVAVFSNRTAPGYLDPAAPDEVGSRAVAELLRDRGVAVDVVVRAADLPADGSATVLVPFPAGLAPAQLEAVQEAGLDVVLVAPRAEVLAVLAPDLEVTARAAPVEVRAPGCDLPAATRAGPVVLGGTLYRGGGAGCYPFDGGAALARVATGDRTVTALGSPDVLLNRTLAEEGNAALALALLGEHPRLVWFRPVPEGPAVGAERSLAELLPPGWTWGGAQLVVAAVLLAAWRARRLGPVVTEPLPVVVRSAEAEEGRARLYRRAGARGHAAAALRTAARARLAPLLGVPVTAGPAEVVPSVAARTGRPEGEVDALLYGPAPVDDAALITLADTLDTYEAKVRRS